jgi:dynein light intermediate chain 1, cytosolic
LEVLFVPPAPASDGLLDGTAASAHNPFPFSHKPNTLDRDHIVVPAEWDSWGKFAVLRDGFDAKAWGEAWERDLSFEAGADEESETGARKLYAALVPDQGPKVRAPLALFSLARELTVISDTAEPASTAQQPDARTSLLAKNYDENARRANRDPRGIFRSPVDVSSPPAAASLAHSVTV